MRYNLSYRAQQSEALLPAREEMYNGGMLQVGGNLGTLVAHSVKNKWVPIK